MYNKGIGGDFMLKKMLVVGMLLTTFTAYSSQAEATKSFGTYENVSLNKKWTITLNKDNLDFRNIEIQLFNEANENVAFTAQVEGKQLIIQPTNLYELDHTYALHLQNKGEKSKQVLKSPQVITFTTTADESALKVYERMDDIQLKWQALKPRYEGEMNQVKPSTTAPYALGSVTDGALQDALNTTNFIRYVADLPAVKLQDEFNREAQGASVVNAANGQLSHYPVAPANMDEQLFELGNNGAKKSNLGVGYPSISYSIQHGYMEDGDPSNIDRVGHRLWILSPKLQHVGFGYAAGFTAMKVIEEDMSRREIDYDAITWPAKDATPTQFFTSEFPWSISLNPELYDETALEDITVTLTNKSANKTWNFSSTKQSDGYFNISTSNYGYLPFTIIFRPEEKPEFKDGDFYQIKIEGLRTTSGKPTVFSYDTTFFDLQD